MVYMDVYRLFRRRCASEPVIGHIKKEYCIAATTFLEQRDTINAISPPLGNLNAQLTLLMVSKSNAEIWPRTRLVSQRACRHRSKVRQ